MSIQNEELAARQNLEWIGEKVIAMMRENELLKQQRHMLLGELVNMVDRYTALVNSGDCGNWNPETEDDVIAARRAIAEVEGK